MPLSIRDSNRARHCRPDGSSTSEAASKGEVSITDLPVHDGRRALRLAPNATNLGGQKPLGVGQLISAAAYRDRSIQLSAAVGGRAGAVAVVGLAALEASGQVVAQTTIYGRDEPPLTLQTSSAERIPATAQSLIVYLVAEGQTGETFFDDIAIRVADTETAPAVAAIGSTTVVKVALDRELGQVRRHLFGTNIEWIRNAQGLWNDRTRSIDDQVVALAKEAGISLLRFPGGGWSDAYDWRDGVGPRDKRPKRPHAPGDKEQSPNIVGTDEVIEVANRIGADLLLTLNLGTGTPALAADWVRYVRERVGVAQTPRLIWELGNELYMKGDVSGGALSPQAYVDKARATIDAVRAIDASAIIYAIGLQNYGRYRFNSYEDWNAKVLRGLAGRIDGLAIYNAYAPVLANRTGASAELGVSLYAGSANEHCGKSRNDRSSIAGFRGRQET